MNSRPSTVAQASFESWGFSSSTRASTGTGGLAGVATAVSIIELMLPELSPDSRGAQMKAESSQNEVYIHEESWLTGPDVSRGRGKRSEVRLEREETCNQ